MTRSRFCSTSRSTTVSPSWVTRFEPICPAIFIPLKTREGVADAPIDPGLRTLCEPWVTGPRLKLWRLIVPAKPLPIEVPETLIENHFRRDPGIRATQDLRVWVLPGYQLPLAVQVLVRVLVAMGNMMRVSRAQFG